MERATGKELPAYIPRKMSPGKELARLRELVPDDCFDRILDAGIGQQRRLQLGGVERIGYLKVIAAAAAIATTPREISLYGIDLVRGAESIAAALPVQPCLEPTPPILTKATHPNDYDGWR